MLKSFSTKQLIFIALMATLLLIINLVLGGGLIAITGIPMINAVVTGITFGLFVVLVALTLPKFGSLTLFVLVYAILELPTPLGGGPGFWPKIPINIITGLVADFLLIGFKYKKWSYFPLLYILVTVNTFVFIYFMKLLGVAGWNVILSMLWWVLPLYFVLGTVGILLGFYIHKKIKDKRAYLQIAE